MEGLLSTGPTPSILVYKNVSKNFSTIGFHWFFFIWSSSHKMFNVFSIFSHITQSKSEYFHEFHVFFISIIPDLASNIVLDMEVFLF